MAERVKMVNGHIIKELTKEEINKELIARGDWPINYYVPGRIFYPYFILINKNRHRVSSLDMLEKFCKKYKKEELENKSQLEIDNLIWVTNNIDNK